MPHVHSPTPPRHFLVIDSLLHAADWLASAEAKREEVRVDDAHAGALALAAADLEHQVSLKPPRHAVWLELADAVRALPPQWAHLSNAAPVAQWLSLASLAEHWGALRLAWLILTDVERLLHVERPATEALAREYRALCWTRRGRIARTRGQLEDAAICYEFAAKLTRQRPWHDAHPQALLGLAALAANRGNIPAVERRLRPLLRESSTLPALYSIAAHQLMSVAKRKRHHHIDALLHAWAAFDLLDGSDFRREQLVATMADIALEAGDPHAAARGFDVVLSTTVRPLVRAPALYGAVRARLEQLGSVGTTSRSAAAVGRDPILTGFASQLQALREASLAPTESVLVYLAVAELAIAWCDVPQAVRALDDAEQLAGAVGLHERQFSIDAARMRLHTVCAPVSATTHVALDTMASPHAAASRHPAFDRLLQLQ